MWMKYTAVGLSPEDQADVSAVIAAIHLSIDDEEALLAVHRVLETVRARTVRRHHARPSATAAGADRK